MYHRYVYAYNYRATVTKFVQNKIKKDIFMKDIYGGTKIAWSTSFQRYNLYFR